MFEGKKILILDLVIFSISFIFVFWLSKTDFILNFLVWFVKIPVSLFHEIGHGFICAVGGGFPSLSFAVREGHFFFTAPCFSFFQFNSIVRSIEIIFGLIFNCILIFLLFYFASATNEKHWNNFIFSFFISTYAWITVDHLQNEIYREYFFSFEDIPEFASFFGIPINALTTFLAALMILLIVIALRYGLEEEQKSGKINVINLEILPFEIAYADFFKFLFFILCIFIGITILIQFLQPNILGIILGIIMVAFAVHFHTVYKVGNKFRHIITNIKINLKEVKTSFSFLSAVFQCTTEKDVVFSITYNREGWTINVPSKKISVKLPVFITAKNISKRVNRIFTYHRLR